MTGAGVAESHVAFNECLAVLYRDGQGMAYHDDGEPGELVVRPDYSSLCSRELIQPVFFCLPRPGLGPLVAGLSLGADAKMSFRRKKSCRRAEKKAGGEEAADGRAEPLTADLDVTLSHGVSWGR
jgi:hypothetical protein